MIEKVVSAFQDGISKKERNFDQEGNIGSQISTIRLKEGYHHYREPDSLVVEIGDEHYSNAAFFIYDAAYSQQDRDENEKSAFEFFFDSTLGSVVQSSGQGRSSSAANQWASSRQGRSFYIAKQFYDIYKMLYKRRYVLYSPPYPQIDCINSLFLLFFSLY